MRLVLKDVLTALDDAHTECRVIHAGKRTFNGANTFFHFSDYYWARLRLFLETEIKGNNMLMHILDHSILQGLRRTSKWTLLPGSM